MDNIVISEHKTSTWIFMVLAALPSAFLILVCINQALQYYANGDVTKIVIIVLLAMVLVAIVLYNLITSVKSLTVCRNDIKLKYKFIGKEVIIHYDEIAYISNLISRSDGIKSFSKSRTCVIGLNDGTEYSFGDGDYENYEELKDAIWVFKHTGRE